MSNSKDKKVIRTKCGGGTNMTDMTDLAFAEWLIKRIIQWRKVEKYVKVDNNGDSFCFQQYNGNTFLNVWSFTHNCQFEYLESADELIDLVRSIDSTVTQCAKQAKKRAALDKRKKK